MHITNRNYKIDCLRGMAILVVLVLHFNISYHIEQSVLNQVFCIDFIKAVASNGNYAVTVFFVISGFLITSTSLERHGVLEKMDLVEFYVFRFARIMPCLILVLSLITAFNYLHVPIFQNTSSAVSFALTIFSVLTFWHNGLMAKMGYFNYCLNIFWSLSVEEIFYLAFPLICLSLKKSKLIILSLCALIVIAPFYRSYYTNDEIVALYGYLSCFDAIAIGCLTAIFTQKITLGPKTRKVFMSGAVMLMLAVYFHDSIMENVVLGVSLMAAGAALFLMGASDSETAQREPGFLGRMLCYFGKNSYELYLFHIIVLAFMKEILKQEELNNYTKLVWMALFFIVSTIVAGVISKYYSQPVNKGLRRLLLRNLQQKSLIPSYTNE